MYCLIMTSLGTRTHTRTSKIYTMSDINLILSKHVIKLHFAKVTLRPVSNMELSKKATY